MVNFVYNPEGATITAFMRSKAHVRGIQGPVGSGKSTACVAECLKFMLAQAPGPDGWRRTRGAVIRNTAPELEMTTLKTWLAWLPEADFGTMRWRSPFRHLIQIPEIQVESEVWFLALDREEDIKKLLSLELSWVWMNEARELRRNVVTNAISRVGRYPREIDGGVTRPGIIMDTNAPTSDHWWAIMSGQTEPPEWMGLEDRMTLVKPDSWEFFLQPPAVLDIVKDGELVGYEPNPERDNASFTKDAYYSNLLQGQTRNWIQNMVQNKLGGLFKGRPVYQQFAEGVHVAREPFGPMPGHKIHVGIDFGLTPAAAFLQDVHGQVRVFDELVARDMPASLFAPMLYKHCAERGYFEKGFRISFVGDPAGDQRAGTDAVTPFQIFRAHKIPVKPSWTNEPDIRIGAVQTQLVTMVDGRPGYLLSPSCTYLLQAKRGGYAYKPDQEEIDKKSIYSHVSDGEQYAALDAGYGKRLIRAEGGRAFTQAQVSQDLFHGRSGVSKRRSGLQDRRPVMLSRGS